MSNVDRIVELIRQNDDDAYRQGYARAVAVAVGVVAAELGDQHELVDRLVVRLGEQAPT